MSEFPVDVVAALTRLTAPGATAGRGKFYASDVAGITQGFFQAGDGTLTQISPPLGVAGQFLKLINAVTGETAWFAGIGTGDVTGPGASVPGDIATFTDASGMLIQDSGVNILASVVTGVQGLELTNGAFGVTLDPVNITANYTVEWPDLGAPVAGYVLTVQSVAGPVLTLAWQAGASATSYRQTFTDADLVAGVLTVTHSLGVNFNAVTVYSNANLLTVADSVLNVDANTVAIDLSSFQAANGGAIVGSWNVVVNS